MQTQGKPYTLLSVEEGEVMAYAWEEIRKSFERVDISAYLAEPANFWQGWQVP